MNFLDINGQETHYNMESNKQDIIEYNKMKSRRLRKYEDAVFACGIGWIGIILICIFAMLFSGCHGIHYLSDAEFDDTREEHVNITYYAGNVYWGYYSGHWYYYGKPHFYPWYYYYTIYPPATYSVTHHVNIHRDNTLPIRRPKKDRLFDNSSNIKVWKIKEQSVYHMQTIKNNKRPNITKINKHNNTVKSKKKNIRINTKRPR